MTLGPIKLISIETEQVEDWEDLDYLVTEYEPVYEYDGEDNETQVGIKIIKSTAWTQKDADKDWKKVLGYIKNDEQRMEDYGIRWNMMGIGAKAILHFPTGDSSIVHEVDSPGIYGIESDSGEIYIRSNEETEIAILLDMLDAMNVCVPNDFVCNLLITDNEITVGEIRSKYPER